MPEYQCTKCNKFFDIQDEGIYIGPENKKDTNCNPFMIFIYLCAECNKL